VGMKPRVELPTPAEALKKAFAKMEKHDDWNLKLSEHEALVLKIWVKARLGGIRWLCSNASEYKGKVGARGRS